MVTGGQMVLVGNAVGYGVGYGVTDTVGIPFGVGYAVGYGVGYGVTDTVGIPMPRSCFVHDTASA
jgi:hypothetical protein